LSGQGERLQAPVVWCWDNLNVHLAGELGDFARENAEWVRVFQMPADGPDLNPMEGVWSCSNDRWATSRAANLDHLVRVTKRKLKKIQYRPHLVDGCLAATGLIIEPPDTAGST
jgi:hypothetical protein